MEKRYEIRNLCCANCGSKIEAAINKLEEVESAVLNFPMKKIIINGEHSETLLEKINKIARSIEPDSVIVPIEDKRHHHHHDEECGCDENEHHHHHHDEECGCEEHEHHHHHHDEECGCEEHEHHHHDEECGCEEHEHHHHHHDEECGCEEHEHHHHHHDEECGCGEHEHHHHHHDEECGCEEHEHHHHHHDEECGCEEHEHHHHHHGAAEKTVKYTINNLDCAHCGAKIEEALNHLDGIESAQLNFPMKTITLHGVITDDTLRIINEKANEIEPGVEIIHLKTGKGKRFVINNMDCAHCGAKIEEALNHLEGIDSAQLNFPMKIMTICGNIDDHMIELINKTANDIEPGVEIVPETTSSESVSRSVEAEESGLKKEIVPVIIGVVLFAAAVILSKTTSLKLLYIILFVAAYLVLGKGVLMQTWKNIKVKNFFDENFLMTVTTIGAFALGEYSEAVGVMLFFKIGELFEEYAVSKSRKAITDIAELRVDEADVLRNGEFVRIHSDDIEIGDILRIKAGERIAVDGVVESGDSRIDTSAVNGEPVPVAVHKGDQVMSGCINQADTFTLRATAAAEDSMIAKITRAVEDASASKPKVDRFITRFSKVYTPIVIAVAVLTAVLGSVITHDPAKWIYSALTFLVISCPCALVLSVPLAYFSGIGAASKLGILFKGGSAVESLGKVKTIAFDKTGTLTNGSFEVTSCDTFGEMNSEELLRICGSCEQSSTHPVAESIVSACRKKDMKLSEPEKVTEFAGRGVGAVLEGRNILCGNERLMKENGIVLPDSGNVSGSVVYVACNGNIEGRIVVSDSVKSTSAEAVSQLNSMGLSTVMLTGDKTANAEVIANELGIGTVKGNLMPDGKLAEIGRIRQESGAVMFVGDGINDGPVLAGADVGGAMQTGADLALEAADVVFMSSEPESVVKAKRISDKTLRISYENIIFALVIKAAVLVLGLLGHPNMWLAVFADSGTAMLLILNSIRALSTKQYSKTA
ncbi:MAG TPA: heavy metal translocating P-type ATPase [Ruminococcus sp.]|nr:heavy metal translocating P-type ATPase [Ruminococcus sp.]